MKARSTVSSDPSVNMGDGAGHLSEERGAFDSQSGEGVRMIEQNRSAAREGEWPPSGGEGGLMPATASLRSKE